MDPQELKERIAAFPRWYYEFDLGAGITTPTPDASFVIRNEQRRRYFFEPLLRHLGGSLASHRILDLGCNAGFFSLLAVEAGADFVLGVDAREMFIEQAGLVFEARDIDRSRYSFEVGNVFTHSFQQRFDTVLCLGLLDQVCKPVELFEVMSGVGAQTIVLDTDISRSNASVLALSSLYDKRAVVDYETILIPSRQALFELAAQFGYRAVCLAPNFSDYTGLTDYRDERRRAFICSRSRPLSGFEEEPAHGLMPWWLRALRRAAGARHGRRGASDSR
jgi:tRNA (mo5U34)-methyltransferase